MPEHLQTHSSRIERGPRAAPPWPVRLLALVLMLIGVVLLGGGLVFIAAATDNLIRAIDLETGETVWQDVPPAGGQATPMTYEVDGRQYLVIMAGGHHFMETPIGDELVAYALPRTAG